MASVTCSKRLGPDLICSRPDIPDPPLHCSPEVYADFLEKRYGKHQPNCGTRLLDLLESGSPQPKVYPRGFSEQKREQVLELIRSGKAVIIRDIQRETGLQNSTVHNIVHAMMKQGILERFHVGPGERTTYAYQVVE